MHLSFSSTLLKHCFSGAKYENHVMSKKTVGSNPDPTGFYLIVMMRDYLFARLRSISSRMILRRRRW